MTTLTWRWRLVLSVLLLVGSYESARNWLTCLATGRSFDVYYICSVTVFGFHHVAAIVMFVAALWIVLSGLKRRGTKQVA